MTSGKCDEILLARYAVKKSVLELRSPFAGGDPDQYSQQSRRVKGIIHLFQKTTSKINKINKLCRSSIGYGRDLW